MNIVYIVSSRMPATRAYGYAIAKLCEEWGRMGHQVELVIPDRRHGLKQDLFAFYGLEQRFHVAKLKSTDFLGLRDTSSKTLFSLDLIFYAYSVKRRRFSADSALYTREYLLSFLLRKRNLFLEIHTIQNSGMFFRAALRRAKGFVAISNGVREELESLGVPEENILVAHDGVDVTKFERATADRAIWRQFGIDPNKKIVLYTGHFYEWKGADTLAEAAKVVGEDVHVVLMGGVDRELEQFQQTYRSTNITILPQQPRAQIPTFLKSADLLVLPNSAKAEISRLHASPLKLFEYMASGVPILASDVPSLREILSEKEAYFFQPDDPKSLAEQISSAMKDGDAPKKAAEAFEKVKSYTWNARAEKIANFIEQKL